MSRSTAQTTADVPTFGGGSGERYVPGRIVLRVNEQAVRPYVGGGRVALTAATARQLPDSVAEPLDFLRREIRAKSVTPVVAPPEAERIERSGVAPRDRMRLAVIASVAESESEQLAGLSIVQLPQTREVTPRLLTTLEDSPAIDFAEPMPARWLLAEKADPLRNKQWGLRAIRWFEADPSDASDVTVAILDSGIDTHHPDLREAIAEYHHDGFGALDVPGHGTHVAGIIGAATNNAIGISGVARCRLAMWKIVGDTPAPDGNFYVDGDRFLQALREVGVSGAKVLNLSLGGPVASQGEQVLMDWLDDVGVTIVGAMGNSYEHGNETQYPGAYTGVLAVGSVTEAGVRSRFSNTGRHVGLAAPGSNILSTVPTRASDYRADTNYASWSGTSMATPHVAAAAALVASKHPDWRPQEIKEHLVKAVARIKEMKRSKWTQEYGAGLLDLEAALS